MEMKVRRREGVTDCDRTELTHRLLSYRSRQYDREFGYDISCNLIASVNISDTRDYITLRFLDGKICKLRLGDSSLPEFDEDLDLRLPVTSISRFKANILRDIICTYYEQLIGGRWVRMNS